MVTGYHCIPGWQQMSRSQYKGGLYSNLYYLYKTHRQIHRQAPLYITITKDSDNTNPVVSTHGHDSIQYNVILLFPPLLVSPSRVFRGNLVASLNLGSILGLFPHDFWLSLSPLWSRPLVLALSGPRCMSWHSLALWHFLALCGAFWLSVALLDSLVVRQKPQEKFFLKNLRKILCSPSWLSSALCIHLGDFLAPPPTTFRVEFSDPLSFRVSFRVLFCLGRMIL